MSTSNGNTPAPQVRVIKTVADPYAGLRGHAYIEARRLNKPVQRVQTSAQKKQEAK